MKPMDRKQPAIASTEVGVRWRSTSGDATPNGRRHNKATSSRLSVKCAHTCSRCPDLVFHVAVPQYLLLICVLR